MGRTFYDRLTATEVIHESRLHHPYITLHRLHTGVDRRGEAHPKPRHPTKGRFHLSSHSWWEIHGLASPIPMVRELETSKTQKERVQSGERQSRGHRSAQDM